MNRRWVAVLTIGIFFSGAATADDMFSLAAAEHAAAAHSAHLAAAEAEYASAVKRAEAARAQSGPRVTIDGQYRWLAHVPELSLPIPGAAPLRLGDNHAYSLGATATWLMWDRGGRRDAYRGAQAAASARRAEADAVRRRVLLGGRSAYYAVVLAREQTAILTRAVALAQSQHDDIVLKVRAGTKSRMDAIAARQELLRRSRQLRQAQVDQAQAVRTLARVTGRDINPTQPLLTEILADLLSQRRDPASLRLKADHPDARAFRELASASRYAQSGFEAGLWPKLSLQARSSVEYPDQMLREQFTQHMAAAAVAWTVYEGGQSRAQAAASTRSADAADQRAEDALADLRTAWETALDQRAALEDQKNIDTEIVAQAQELARIVRAAYDAGTVEYLQVEDANMKALESTLSLARTGMQLLINDAVLASMAEE